jgi:hypothetical protein
MRDSALAAYAKLPLTFVENRGQNDGQVRCNALGKRHAFYLTRDGVVLSFASGSMALRFVDAHPRVPVVGEQPAAGEVNDFRGSDPGPWRTRLPHYAQVVYRDLWLGVDLQLREQSGVLKYEFHVRAGAPPADIRLTYSEAQELALDDRGGLTRGSPGSRTPRAP